MITRKKAHPSALCPCDRMDIAQTTTAIFQIWFEEKRNLSGFFVTRTNTYIHFVQPAL
ncbi:unannotated protein [freshwater metagenome]|uniref:Unannotated protein n=1 Tax=freshwater metagenome TaxID=449393 RepID=A0A6J6EW19_9ZZZZ